MAYIKIDTVNVVIFAGGKICKNIGKTFHMEEIFAKRKSREKRKNYSNAKISALTISHKSL